MLKALIFDVDGTLAETEETHRAAFNEAFARAGLGWSWDRDLYGKLLKVAGGKERIRHYIQAHQPGYAARANLGGFVAGLHKVKTALYGELISSGATDLRPGVEDLMTAAKRDGVRLAIATTTSRPNVDKLLRATLGAHWTDIIEFVAAADSADVKKPAPDVYLRTLRGLDLPASACVAIEDTNNGLRAARGAGISTVVTPSIYSADEDFEGACAVAASLCELVPRKSGAMARGPAILAAIQELHRGIAG